MTRRRPGTRPEQPCEPRRPAAGSPEAGRKAPKTSASVGVWYAALIGIGLLIAAGIYIVFLEQQRQQWQKAADQLTIGQELLRADRDELLGKAREREATLSAMEAAREQERLRLESLESQRSRLQGSVLKLTQALAQSQQQADGVSMNDDQAASLERTQRRLERDLAKQRSEVTRLEAALAEKDRALSEQVAALRTSKAQIETMQSSTEDFETTKRTFEKSSARLEQQLADRQRQERQRQIIRGHRASLGEVKPYIAEVGPEDWRVIESWLGQQLGRPMAVPDLSSHDWSYEGARLLATIDGPPMAMLLYADSDEHPASLTVARDLSGERDLLANREGGLNLLDWREERHAFFLAGEASEDVLKAVAVDLQNQPPMLNDEAVVPVSRYVRPSFRPETRP